MVTLLPVVAFGTMNARTYIRDKKRVVSSTGWEQGGIPKARFPLFSDRKPLGPGWWWRSATLASDTQEYRLLVQLRTDKPNFKAWLAVKIGKDWAVIARLESHMHAGLHCHMQCLETGVTIGEIDPPDAVCIPHWREFHRRPNEVISKNTAWDMALEFFRAQAGEVGDLL